MKTPVGVTVKDERTQQALERVMSKHATYKPGVAFLIRNDDSTLRLRAQLQKDSIKVVPNPMSQTELMIQFEDGQETPVYLEAVPGHLIVRQVMGPKELMAIHTGFAISEPNGDEAAYSTPDFRVNEGEIFCTSFGNGQKLIVAEGDTDGNCRVMEIQFSIGKDGKIAISTKELVSISIPKELALYRDAILQAIDNLEAMTGNKCAVAEISISVSGKTAELQFPPELKRLRPTINEALARATKAREVASYHQNGGTNIRNGYKPRK